MIAVWSYLFERMARRLFLWRRAADVEEKQRQQVEQKQQAFQSLVKMIHNSIVDHLCKYGGTFIGGGQNGGQKDLLEKFHSSSVRKRAVILSINIFVPTVIVDRI